MIPLLLVHHALYAMRYNARQVVWWGLLHICLPVGGIGVR